MSWIINTYIKYNISIYQNKNILSHDLKYLKSNLWTDNNKIIERIYICKKCGVNIHFSKEFNSKAVFTDQSFNNEEFRDIESCEEIIMSKVLE